MGKYFFLLIKMVVIKYLAVFFFLSQACSTSVPPAKINPCPGDVKKSFEKNKLVPDVLCQAPSKFVQVTYAERTAVLLGNELSVSSVKHAPTCVEWEADPRLYYTLVMVDPDAPSRHKPFLRNIKHWLIVNISGNDLSSGTTVAGYLWPLPGPLSGPHRYTFLVFLQTGCININKFKGSVDRLHFDVNKFAKKYKLKPYAGNFFVAKSLLL